jgi:hypothetical protein
MTIQVFKPTQSEMLKCVARYHDLKGVSTGLPDMHLESCRRTFFGVLGFEQPKEDEQYSPFGDQVTPQIGHLKTGYGAAFVKARPGRGVLIGVERRFECVEAAAGTEEGTLFAIISGEMPVVEYSPEAVRQMSAATGSQQDATDAKCVEP